MTKSRTWTLGTALVVVLVLVAGWLLVISPKRSSAAELRQQTLGVIADNATAEGTIGELKVQQQQLPSQQAELAAIQQQMPNSPLLPSLLRQLSSQAYAAGVSLGSVAPANTISSVPGDAGVDYIPVTIIVDGSFTHVKSFLLNLETNKRAVLVTGFSIALLQASGQTANTPNELGVTITTRVFIAGSSGTTTTTSSGGNTTASTSGATPAPTSTGGATTPPTTSAGAGA